jgi:hypothetical protein
MVSVVDGVADLDLLSSVQVVGPSGYLDSSLSELGAVEPDRLGSRPEFWLLRVGLPRVDDQVVGGEPADGLEYLI